MRRRLQITSLVLLLVLAFATTLPAGAAEPNGIVAFISDFGKVDHYVGAMTGTALTKFPDANIVNITHQVEQFNVKQGALTTYLAARHFPPGTVFCVAVDPGGASGRKSLALKTETGHYFVGSLMTLRTSRLRMHLLSLIVTTQQWRAQQTCSATELIQTQDWPTV